MTYRVLVVSSGPHFNERLKDALPTRRFGTLHFVKDEQEARRQLVVENYDLILVNAASQYDTLVALARDCASRLACGILFLVKAERFLEFEEKLSLHGVYVLAKPVSRATFMQAITLVMATRERLRRMEEQNATIEEKMKEIRLVNQAKWLLIEHRGMSEASAHRYIEKKAMDLSLKKGTVAAMMIKEFKEE